MKQKIYTSVDPVVFKLDSESQLQVLLITQPEDKDEPFPGMLRLPGGVIDTDEVSSLDDTAESTLMQKTGVSASYFEQLKTYGGNLRDPRGWTVSVAYMGITSGDYAGNIWVGVDQLPKLAFDHNQIVSDALDRLRSKVNYSLLPAHFLPQEFTMSSLKKIYEAILGETLDKSSFLKKIRETNAIEMVDGKFQTGDFRPAQMWRIKEMHHFNRNLKKSM